jgi:5-methylthioribose kinase
MVAADGMSVKVIDPEFAVFAPPGLDVGSLLFALVCGFIFRVQQPAPTNSGDAETHPGRKGRAAATDSLRDAIRSVWVAYSSELLAAGTAQAELRRIGEDAVGYAMCEVVRTSLGFAGARDPGRRLHTAKAVSRYQDAAVRLAQRCMVGRRDAQPLDDALAPIEMLLRVRCRRRWPFAGSGRGAGTWPARPFFV